MILPTPWAFVRSGQRVLTPAGWIGHVLPSTLPGLIAVREEHSTVPHQRLVWVDSTAIAPPALLMRDFTAQEHAVDALSRRFEIEYLEETS